ncbi:Digalactosyldiacylglycerol synthase 1, chloroplastic [Datura stramonium]|uniref:Digalactosyldiacylglycerol synthase 1, chloroplastic n=1 Tax=Datura stramonium TaxID=4076 RepID=A0ABS8S8Q9_DATST|nr:Digalactosyldiacylglycerol synthase 1, chloroplastic [Datura stramonium]
MIEGEIMNCELDLRIASVVQTTGHCYEGTQDLPKPLVCNVHGVNPKFLKIGEKAAADRQSDQHVYGNGEDAHEVQSTAKCQRHEGRDDTDDSLHGAALCTGMVELLQCGNLDQPSDEIFPANLTLTPEEQYKLSWEASTQRFMEHSDLDKILTSETRLDRRCGKGVWKSVSMANLRLI